MKLHLNLTLRRAVLAAMAMVAVGTTQADNIVTDKNTSGKDVYIVGVGTMDTAAWEQLWTDAPDAGTVTIGTHAGAADVTLAAGTYNAPKVYIAGVGNNSGGTVANDGSLNVGAATLNVEELSVGQSLVGGKGTLIVNGGALNVGTGLYVGAYEGEGEVEATKATITVEGGAEGAVFAVGYRESVQAGEDKATLSGGSITVGTEGGVVDTTIVGRGSGKDELYLQDGNIATFHDQTVVGELAGSDGIIYVSGSESKLSMDNTVLGVAQGASGTICVEGGSSAESSHLVIGQAGEGCVEVEDGASLTATTILAGEKATGEGVLDVEDAAVTAGNIMVGVAGTGGLSIDDAGTVTTDALVLGSKAGAAGSAKIYDGTLNATQTLHVGDAGSGSMSVYGGTVDAGTIVLGSQVTGSGTLEISTATFGEGDEAVEYKGGKVIAAALYVGNQGTGKVVVDGEKAELEAETAYVIGTDSKLDTQAGSTTLTNAVVLGGTLSTGEGASTTVSGELILDSAANLTSAGTTKLNQATVHEGSSLKVTGGTLTGGTLVSEGDIANDGEIIVNSLVLGGTLFTGEGASTEVSGELILDSAANLTSAGTTKLNQATVHEGSSLKVTGGTLATSGLTNNGTIINAGTWNASGTTDTSKGSFTNNAYMNASGTLTTAKVAGTGEISNTGEWAITGLTEQQNINNSGTITITGNGSITTGEGSITTGELAGTGSITILVDGTSKSTGDQAVIQVGAIENQDVAVHIDTTNASSLVGKTVNFLKIGEELIKLDDQAFSTSKDWFYNWADSNLFTGVAGNGQQLSFTGGKDGITFTKLGAIETKEVEAELPSNVTVELEVTTETVLTVTDTLKNKGESIEENQSSITITETDTLQSAELSQGVDKDTQEEVRTNVIIGKNVESTGDTDSTKVQSVVVTQKTTIETPEGEENIEMKETLSVSGVALVFEGKSEHKGNGKAQGSELGFNESTETGTLTTTKKDEQDNTITVQNTVSKVDIMEVKENAEVDVKDISMHSTHALTISAGSTITFENVDLHVGGTEDVNLSKEVQVVMYDETGKPKTDKDGNVITKTETVDSGTHLTVDTTITNAKVEVKGDSVVKFEKIYDPLHGTEMGSTTITQSEVEIDTNAVLGDNGEHMDEIAFTDNTKVNNSGTVNNAKFDNSELQNNNGTVDNVVISNGSHLKGKGNLKKVHVDKDSTLTVGSSPGKFTANELTVDGKTNFYIITNSDEWTTKNITATEGSGAISQLVVEGPVTLNGAISFIYQEKLSDGTYADCANQAEARDFMADKFLSVFEEGDTIQFVTGDDLEKNITFGSSFSINTETLPTLEEGMFWDTTDFFTQGIVTVMAEILEEPTRIANTLVSAGETVLNFGRVAESQAELREAGTTRTWGSALAVFDSVDSGADTNGYDYDAWGAAVGVDHAFTNNTVIGAAFGCTWGENSPEHGTAFYEAGSIDQDSKMVALYGVHKFQTKGLLNDVKLNAFAAYGWFSNDSTRNAIKGDNTATAEWDSQAWVVSASLSRDITTDNGVVFTPYVGVEYTKASMDDFSEQGRSYAADYTADEDYSNLSVKVGVTVSKNFDGFTPYFGIAYINDVDRSAAQVTATGKREAVTAESALPGRNALQLRLGATWKVSESVDLNAAYTAELRDKATEQRANVGIGITF